MADVRSVVKMRLWTVFPDVLNLPARKEILFLFVWKKFHCTFVLKIRLSATLGNVWRQRKYFPAGEMDDIRQNMQRKILLARQDSK